jgi:hypothetical protein
MKNFVRHYNKLPLDELAMKYVLAKTETSATTNLSRLLVSTQIIYDVMYRRFRANEIDKAIKQAEETLKLMGAIP